jgi:NitT/TauT family transport system ATP-binding protein/sulfonate transport system ATP-binding protein
MSKNVVEAAGVCRTYTSARGEDVRALENVSISVSEGEFVSIIGSSGCGKTTLLRLIAGLDKPQSGTISLNGAPIVAPSPESGYVFQQQSLFPWLTVEKNIAAGLRARHVYKQYRDDVPKYISLVGLDGFEHSYPHQISGGMAQRAAIARSLINRPSVLLLDEPMGALDSFTRADLQDKLLEIWSANGTTMILVTHDVEEAIYLSDRIVIMTPRPGKISEEMKVNFPHPRHRGSPEFLGLRRVILEKLHLASAQPQPEYRI